MSLKHKTCVALRENLWSLRLKRSFQRKWKFLRRRGIGLYYPQFTPKVSRLEDKRYTYARQLKAKQKLRKFYGTISEKAFKALFRTGKVSRENLLARLERRLDVSLCRMWFVSTPFQAQQLISHGKVLVNQRVVKKRSFPLKEGDLIEVHFSREQRLLSHIRSHQIRVPSHLEVHFPICSGIFLHEPYSYGIFYGVPMDVIKARAFYK